MLQLSRLQIGKVDLGKGILIHQVLTVEVREEQELPTVAKDADAGPGDLEVTRELALLGALQVSAI